MSESIEQIREKAVAIAHRLKTDSTFKAQLEQHPEETLIAAGFPEIAVPEFLVELQIGDVSGYALVDCVACSVCCKTTAEN